MRAIGVALCGWWQRCSYLSRRPGTRHLPKRCRCSPRPSPGARCHCSWAARRAPDMCPKSNHSDTQAPSEPGAVKRHRASFRAPPSTGHPRYLFSFISEDLQAPEWRLKRSFPGSLLLPLMPQTQLKAAPQFCSHLLRHSNSRCFPNQSFTKCNTKSIMRFYCNNNRFLSSPGDLQKSGRFSEDLKLWAISSLWKEAAHSFKQTRAKRC